MSLYIFLNEEAHALATKGMTAGIAFRTAELGGIKVSLDADGRIHYEVRNETGPAVSLVPIPLRKYVESISWQMYLPPDSLTKIVGRYIHLSAEAIVDHRRDRQGWRSVRISGPVIDDVYQLYFQLRNGQATLLEPWQETAEPDAGQEEAAGEASQSPQVPLTCQACQAKYTIASEKIAGKAVKVRCRKCGAAIRVDGNAAIQRSVEPRRGLHLVKDPDPKKPN